MQAPEAPILFVGTHKDDLNTDVDEKLSKAQELFTRFLNHTSLAKKIIQNIRKPSASTWFFAVDSKSRQRSSDGGVQCSDTEIAKLRCALDEVVMNDKRKVKGEYYKGVQAAYLNIPVFVCVSH